jgi:hypothetical protein
MRVQLLLAALQVAFFLVLYYSEWTKVVVTGDRCLFPESFHLFVSEICVGESGASSRKRGPLCLPLETDEFIRLPPTEDGTLLNFGILDTCCQLLVLSPGVALSLALSTKVEERDLQQGSYIVKSVLHLGTGALAAIAIAVALSAPTASAARWADGMQTCDVQVFPGVAVPLAFGAVILETALAWNSIRQ